uniref:Extracellular matrix protein 2-like n=2 Tax=Gouania willdenowi TaxID=441366 RepID=A0A8C5H4Y0_GOUWI
MLDMAENNLRNLSPEHFSGLMNLDTLDLSLNHLDDESFSQSPLSNLHFLRKLNLTGNELTKIPALPPSLEELRMNDNKLNALTPSCFEGLSNLMNLELGGNILYEGSVSPLALQPLQRLLVLELSNNRFRFLPGGLPASLQELELSDNQIQQLTEEALINSNNVKMLNLSHNQLHELSISTPAWARLMTLATLDLSYNQFTSIPTNLPRPLRRLALDHNRISRIPALSFRHLRPGLQFLQLSHNALSNDGVEQKSFVGIYRSLDELLLDNNYLVEVPRCIRQFKNLRKLTLDNNQIRLLRQWEVCHPHNSGSVLASVHLENNLLEVEKIPPKAFSCLTDTAGLVLYPQQGSM